MYFKSLQNNIKKERKIWERRLKEIWVYNGREMVRRAEQMLEKGKGK